MPGDKKKTSRKQDIFTSQVRRATQNVPIIRFCLDNQGYVKGKWSVLDPHMNLQLIVELLIFCRVFLES